MIPGLGKQIITIGSAPHCDITLTGAGVAPEHARLVHQGGGKLWFSNLDQGQSAADGRLLSPGEQVPFDFRTRFFVGEAEVPFDHPAIALTLMGQGQQSAPPGQLIIGRDPARASLLLQHPSVSGLHATVAMDPATVTDQRSTSGTYIGGSRIPTETATALPPQDVVYFGPVPVRVELLAELARAAATSPLGAPAAQQGGTYEPTRGMEAAFLAGAGPAAAAAAEQVGTHAVQAAHVAPEGAAPAEAAQAPARSPMRKHKTVFGQLDLSDLAAGVKTIGRTPNNDIVIDHPQVSSRHAQVEQHNDQLYVVDRGSANGTYVRGQRVARGQKVPIEPGEKIYIGPMPLQLHISASGAVEVYHEAYAEAQWAGRPLYEVEAWSLFLEVPDRDDKTQMKVLLDNVSFKALPGDMIALMGPSGAGKTTLLMALNGYLPPSTGLVRINGEDLYSIYDTLRGSIGYVPQDDLVHPELTVFEAVKYSAKFRLPPDFSEEEIDARVHQTLRDLGLESVANLEIGRPEKKILSGGQRKRVNIALELVTDPVILYLDEPTSGLAADDATALINLLHGFAKSTGKTIIVTIHQPAKDEFEKFNQALILGYGGVPMFFGPTSPDAYRFFGSFQEKMGCANDVDNPRDAFAQITARENVILEQMLAQDPGTRRAAARHAAALQWRQEFYSDDNETYRKMYSGRRAVGTGDGQRGIPDRRPATSGQFRLLFSRYFKCKWRDRSGTAIMFAQAPIIGGLIALVFGMQKEGAPHWCLGALQELSNRVSESAGDKSLLQNVHHTSDHTAPIFFLVLAAVWFGTSNAAREIVRERAIYLRERMVNLGLLNYVLSKFVLLSLFCMLQCLVLLVIVFFGLGLSGGAKAFFTEYAALCSTSFIAVAIGLLLSTAVTSSEAAMALTPIALIPQVVLGGLLVPPTTIGNLSYLMYIVPARWGFEAAITPERVAIKDDPGWLIDVGVKETDATNYVFDGQFQCAIAQLSADNFNGAWAFSRYEDMPAIPFIVMLGGTFVLLVVLSAILKRRDPV